MPYKKRERICEICGKTFLGIPTKKCCSQECTSELMASHRRNEVLIKVCENCKTEYSVSTEKAKKEQKYCSKKCAWEASKGVSLLDRGYSQEEYDKYIQRTIKRNKSLTGQTWEESFGEEVAAEMRKKATENFSGKKNNMSYESVMERFNLDTLEEACEMMPATGRFGELHPFYGKHHSVESKIQMVKTMEENGMFGKSSNGLFNHIAFQGTWELKYIIDCIENNISIKRYDLEPIYYEFKGEPHHYFPDFIINESEIIEIKGMFWNKEKIKCKKEAAKLIYNNYKMITDVGQRQNPKTFLKNMKNKYKEKLEIKYNPYEEKINV